MKFDTTFLAETIARLTEERSHAVASSSRWKIKEETLARQLRITLKGANGYEKNLDLKKQLAARWKDGERHERVAIASYYVKSWGGIIAIRPQKIESYVDATIRGDVPPFLGIASWSKVRAAASPETEAIFDARVSYSLNALQVLEPTKSRLFFPVLPSRNSTIREAAPSLDAMARGEAGWVRIPREDVYDVYVAALRQAAALLNGCQPVAKAEMALFAEAETLSQRIA